MDRRNFIFRSSLLGATVLSASSFGGEATVAKPSFGDEGRRHVTSVELEQELRASLSANLLEGAMRPPIDFDDPIYCLPTRHDVDAVYNARTTLKQPWCVDVFDCEDFAYSLKVDFARFRFQHMSATFITPFAAGLVWGVDLPGVGRGPHAVNLVLTGDEGVLLVDSTPDGGGIRRVAGWTGKIRYLVI